MNDINKNVKTDSHLSVFVSTSRKGKKILISVQRWSSHRKLKLLNF